MGRCSRAGMDGRFNVARAAKDEAVVAIEAKKKVPSGGQTRWPEATG